MGLDRESIGDKTVGLAMQQRAAALNMDLDSYAGRVLADPQETQNLIEAVVVPETWFFRDVEPYIYLTRWTQDILIRPPAFPPSPEFGSRPPAGPGPLRILSVPSSTGEEPYSIAMALLDAGFGPGQFRIDAWDISRAALEKAKQATYGPASFRTADQGFRHRYFTLDKTGRYILDSAPRQCVHFHLGNLADPGFGAGLAPYHAIFCRNLLIYFTEQARSRAVAALERLLLPHGVLFTGHTEILLFQRLGYIPVNHAKAFACRRPEKTEPPVLPAVRAGCFSGSATAPPVAAQPGTPRPALSKPFPGNLPTLPEPKKEPVAPGQTPSPTGNSQPPAATLLEQARQAADCGLLGQAETLCRTHLSDHAQDAAGYVLLGVICQAGGHTEQAETWLKKALYLDPGHYEALVHMSLLCAMRGDAGGESNYRRRAARCTPGRSGPHEASGNGLSETAKTMGRDIS